MYHFRLHQRRGARKKRSVEDLLEELRRDERVLWSIVYFGTPLIGGSI